MPNDDQTASGIPLPATMYSAEYNMERVRSALMTIDQRMQSTSGETSGTVSTAPGVVYLENELTSLNSGGWTYRTATNQGTDIGPALISACDKLRAANGRGTIKIGPGQFFLGTPIPADKLSGITISGDGSMSTVLTYGAATGAAFSFSGANGYTGGGLHGMAIMLAAGLGDTNTIAINAEGDATCQPDQLRIEDLYITAGSGSQWFSGLRMHGNARTSPQGIRNTVIDSVQIFCCRGTGVWLSNVVQLVARDLGVYVGSGGGQNIYLAGGGVAEKNTTQAYLTVISCVELNVTNISRFVASGVASRINTDTSATDGDVTLFGAAVAGTLSSSVRTKF